MGGTSICFDGYRVSSRWQVGYRYRVCTDQGERRGTKIDVWSPIVTPVAEGRQDEQVVNLGNGVLSCGECLASDHEAQGMTSLR